MRLIDADELKHKFFDAVYSNDNPKRLTDLFKIIDSMPTAYDVEMADDTELNDTILHLWAAVDQACLMDVVEEAFFHCDHEYKLEILRSLFNHCEHVGREEPFITQEQFVSAAMRLLGLIEE